MTPQLLPAAILGSIGGLLLAGEAGLQILKVIGYAWPVVLIAAGACIITVVGGGVLIQPSVACKVVAEFVRLRPSTLRLGPGTLLPEPLSEREIEILRLLATGLTNREIAERLFLAKAPYYSVFSDRWYNGDSFRPHWAAPLL